MENQPIETVELAQESRHRRVKKLWRPIAATALTFMASAGTLHLSNSDTSKDVKVVTDAGEQSRQAQIDKQELRAINAARVKAEIEGRQLELFYNTITWNNVVAWNKAVEANRRIPYDPALWERLHNCEQPGNWYANGHNPADGANQLFQGGLGMSTDAWDMAVRDAAKRGVALPSSALDASIDQQMQGAQVFMEDEGWGWSCHV